MLAPWMIEALRERERQQQEADRASWENQDRIEAFDPCRVPAPTTTSERTEGGIVTVDFTVL
jgi:hypothetical protein